MSAPAISTAQTREAENQLTVTGTVEAVDFKARTVTIRTRGRAWRSTCRPCRAVRAGDGGRRRDGHLLRLRQRAVEARGRTRGRLDGGADDDGDSPEHCRRHENQAEGDDRDHHRLVPCRQGCDLHRPERDEPTRAGCWTPPIQDRRRSQSGRSRRHHQDRGGDALHAAAGVNRRRGIVESPHGLGPVRVGQPVQRQDDQGSDRAAAGRRADQPGETTFDEVYGRMGMFKIGVGYRTSPRPRASSTSCGPAVRRRRRLRSRSARWARPEISRSMSSSPIIQYWGIEGGQRWFFARTRFTPFLGYLVGINRHQDIRGTFVGVPAASHAGAGRAGRQVLRNIVGAQPGSDRGHTHRHWSGRVHGRDSVAVPGRAVGRGLAGRRRPARCQQRELALVGSRFCSACASGSERRASISLTASFRAGEPVQRPASGRRS